MVLTPDLRKTHDTIADRPASGNHFLGVGDVITGNHFSGAGDAMTRSWKYSHFLAQVMASPALEHHFQMRAMMSPALRN
jgi:hypothetical protein